MLLSFSSAAIPTWIVSKFKGEVRYSATAIAYNFAQAMFGGTTPLIATALLEATGSECTDPTEVCTIAWLPFGCPEIPLTRYSHYGMFCVLHTFSLVDNKVCG